MSAGLLALALGAPVAANGLGESVGTAAEPIAIEVLSRHAAFPDDVSLQVRRTLPGEATDVLNLKDAGHVVMARITVQPGAAFPWHTHPGPVIVSVTEGDLVYQQASDCIERDYGTNQAFVDPGTKVHTAWNPGNEPTVLTATFFGVPEGGAPTIPEADQFNRCG
jgi:quercetin dioxygenase-like cupin family protein